MNNAADRELAQKITKAVLAVDAAIATKNELARAAGALLHAAQQRHPGRAAFETFLKLTDGVQYSRAMDLIAVATDRKTVEKLQADAAARQKKHRDKQKALPEPKPEPRAQPKPKPEPVVRDVTDEPGTAEATAERRKAEYADLTAKEKQEFHQRKDAEFADFLGAEETRMASARALAEFTAACHTYLPKITIEADRQKARLLVSELTTSKKKAA